MPSLHQCICPPERETGLEPATLCFGNRWSESAQHSLLMAPSGHRVRSRAQRLGMSSGDARLDRQRMNGSRVERADRVTPRTPVGGSCARPTTISSMSPLTLGWDNRHAKPSKQLGKASVAFPS